MGLATGKRIEITTSFWSISVRMSNIEKTFAQIGSAENKSNFTHKSLVYLDIYHIYLS